MDKLFHLSTRTWVLKTQVCHQTRVSMTQDASFLNSFNNMFTNEIVFEILLYGKYPQKFRAKINQSIPKIWNSS